MRPLLRIMCDLVVKALVCNVWFDRNDCIFNANVCPVHDIILKIDCMLLFWFSSVLDSGHAKLDDSIISMACIRRSLELLGLQAEESLGTLAAEEVQGQSA